MSSPWPFFDAQVVTKHTHSHTTSHTHSHTPLDSFKKPKSGRNRPKSPLSRHSHTHTSTTKLPKSASKALEVQMGDEDCVEVEETYEYEEERYKRLRKSIFIA